MVMKIISAPVTTSNLTESTYRTVLARSEEALGVANESRFKVCVRLG